MTNPAYLNPSYQSAHARARVVAALLIAGAIVAVLSVIVEALQIFLPELTPGQEISDNPGGAAVLLLGGLLDLLTVGIYIATVIVFLMWLYRSCNNLRALGFGRRQISYSPGWAVGSFFVPFVNLVVPYRAVRELWQKSEPPSSDLSFSYSISPPGFFTPIAEAQFHSFFFF